MINFRDLIHNHATQVKAGVMIDGEHGGQILLKGVNIHDLGRPDFLF